MAGMICPVKGCGHSSNDARPPQCAMTDCPGRQTFAPSDFQLKNAGNLKKAFAEHDIPWPTPARRAANFLSWVMEDVNVITAVSGSPRDEQLREFVTGGFLEFTENTHGDNNYAVTSKWLVALSSDHTTKT